VLLELDIVTWPLVARVEELGLTNDTFASAHPDIWPDTT